MKNLHGIRIIQGKRGYVILINNYFINCEDLNNIKGIFTGDGYIVYGASEWVSIKELRRFWAYFRNHCLNAPAYTSVWGTFKPLGQRIGEDTPAGIGI